MKALTSAQRTLLLVLLVFAAPVICAYLILRLGWFTGGVTAHGEMLMPPVERVQWRQSDWQREWALIGICEQQCEPMQSYLQRIKLTLGQYQNRVVVLSVGEQAPKSAANHAEQQLYWRNELPDLPANWQAAGTILIMDPLGHIMLAYPPTPMEQAAEQGRGVKSDLYKMLKLSRVS
ncbi:hypothetical protein K0504_09340 [Neiella marina]|uniref:Transmembrane cytochrome oxidase associated protein n=1 Tax=Neiella holothuriorum TaxID=2870530 RepID=A0ABS7EFW2_9GAMM|nr:hypothetical protein [Neiella holothuriorum]MBW8191239.1 hypothetical protein [Neiella holothuriorum]